MAESVLTESRLDKPLCQQQFPVGSIKKSAQRYVSASELPRTRRTSLLRCLPRLEPKSPVLRCAALRCCRVVVATAAGVGPSCRKEGVGTNIGDRHFPTRKFDQDATAVVMITVVSVPTLASQQY